jgi:hypothetical protein
MENISAGQRAVKRRRPIAPRPVTECGAVDITAIGAGSVTGHDRHGEPWSAECDGAVLVTQQTSRGSEGHHPRTITGEGKRREFLPR